VRLASRESSTSSTSRNTGGARTSTWCASIMCPHRVPTPSSGGQLLVVARLGDGTGGVAVNRDVERRAWGPAASDSWCPSPNVYRPLGDVAEAYSWVREARTAPWVIYVRMAPRRSTSALRTRGRSDQRRIVASG
jgi:hypothetical protein